MSAKEDSVGYILALAKAVEQVAPNHFDIVFGWAVQIAFRETPEPSRLQEMLEELLVMMKAGATEEQKQ